MNNLNYLFDLDTTDDEIERNVKALSKIDIDLKDNARILETQRAIEKIGNIFSTTNISTSLMPLEYADIMQIFYP